MTLSQRAHLNRKQTSQHISSHFIYPLTTRVVGTPQMISQPVFSIFPCSQLPSGTWRTPGLSIPWCCLPTSSSVCFVFFPLSLCLLRWVRSDLMNGRHDHIQKCIQNSFSSDSPDNPPPKSTLKQQASFSAHYAQSRIQINFISDRPDIPQLKSTFKPIRSLCYQCPSPHTEKRTNSVSSRTVPFC